MKDTEIKFHIELSDDNLPEKIFWRATDAPTKGITEAKALHVSVWDNTHAETLRIDLWTKDMQVLEMKRFVVDSIAGMAQTIETATGDKFMAKEMDSLCERLVKHIKEEYRKQVQE